MRAVEVGSERARMRWLELPGKGAPVVFLHGLGSASSCQFPEIAAHPSLAGRRSVLIDLLGFGFSDRPASFSYSLSAHADAVGQAIDSLGAGPVPVLGHSLGGSIAIVLASRRPELVSRLLVAEPNLDPWDGTASVTIARQGRERYLASGHRDLVAYAGREWAAMLRVADPLATFASAEGLCIGSDPPMRRLLQELELPRALILGGLSAPPPGLEALAEHGVAVHTIPRAGHVMMEDAPDAFARLVAKLLDSP